MTGSLFPNAPDREALATMLSKPAPSRTLAIHFTPRSGSSRLTEILQQTRQLGRANELFNPNFMPEMARKFQAPDLETYIAVARRRLRMGDAFSFEITAYQRERIFGPPAAFERHFAGVPSVWLIRQDVVQQAVSLAKMTTIGVAHSVDPAYDPQQEIPYSALKIASALKHIVTAEQKSEEHFAASGCTPLRISYEQTVAMPPETLCHAIAAWAGVSLDGPLSFDLTHRKIGTAKNAADAERFREERAAFVADIEARRAPMLAALADAGALAEAGA